MRKEILIAIAFGIFIGIIVAFGVWRANSALKTKNEIVTQNPSQSMPSPQSEEFKITLAEPEEMDVKTSSPILVSGITKVNSFVVLSSDNEDFIIQNPTGSFEQEIKPLGGINQILVVAFDTEGKRSEVLRTIAFSAEFAEETEKGAENEKKQVTEAADSVREAVRKKLEGTRKNPKAYIGTITDKGKDTLQIKNASGEIQLISVATDASFAKTNKTSTAISFDDIAIGDFILVMGFLTDENGVLDAIRILTTQPLKPPERKVIFGRVSEIVKRQITILASSGETLTFTFPSRWKGPEIDEINEDDSVILVSIEEEGKNLVRTILMVSSSQAPKE